MGSSGSVMLGPLNNAAPQGAAYSGHGGTSGTPAFLRASKSKSAT